METYDIYLRNDKISGYTRLGWLLVFIHIVIFLYLAFFLKDKYKASGYLAALIVMSIAFLVRFYLKKKRTRFQIGYTEFLFLCLIGWATNHEYVFAAITGVLYLLSAFVMREPLVRFSSDSIIYPSISSKRIQWNDLNNALLKDGLLTLDFKNNRIIQQMIDEKRTTVDEKQFNEFCWRAMNTIPVQ
jgi:hypothetical protein